VCKYGRANASSGTEPDTPASSPGPGFLLRHTRFVACALEVCGSAEIITAVILRDKVGGRKEIVDCWSLNVL
jgi:hypothetical protein